MLFGGTLLVRLWQQLRHSTFSIPAALKSSVMLQNFCYVASLLCCTEGMRGSAKTILGVAGSWVCATSDEVPVSSRMGRITFVHPGTGTTGLSKVSTTQHVENICQNISNKTGNQYKFWLRMPADIFRKGLKSYWRIEAKEISRTDQLHIRLHETPDRVQGFEHNNKSHCSRDQFWLCLWQWLKKNIFTRHQY